MFGELLDHVLRNTPGAVAVTMMGYDGISIETRDGGSVPVDIQNAGIEFGHIATQIKTAAAELAAGGLEELSVRTASLVTVLRPVSDEYFVALLMRPDGNTGKGRYLLRLAAPKLAAEL